MSLFKTILKRYLRFLLIFGSLLVFQLLLFGIQLQPVSAAVNTYYVAKNGSDNNPGTQAQPWLTIQKAANTIVAGDTVFVETGTYNEHVVPQNSGSSSNPITFENYPGESPIIDGIGVASGYALFQFSRVSYVNISGFQIQNGSGDAIFVQGSSDINISNITIDNCVGAGIDATPDWNQNPSTYLTINNCTIYNTNTGNDLECLTLMSVNQFEINDCTIHDSTKEGIDCSVGCTNGSIHNCTVYNVKEGIYVDPEQTAESNISIYDNLVYNTPDNGIILSSELNGTQQSMTGISIYNNILYGNAVGFSVGSISVPANTFSFTFINNTIYNNSYGGITLGNASYILSGIVRNNIIVGTSGNILTSLSGSGSQVVIDHNLFYNPGGYNASNIYGTNYIQADPLFNNPPTDFSLQSGSPAIDAGSATAAHATDYIGTSRPQGVRYDIGAYEYIVLISPVVNTNTASNITISGTTLNGSLTALGSTSPVLVSFEWGNDTNYSGGNITCNPSSISSIPTVFSASLSGLTAGTTYHYRAKAVGTTTSYGTDQIFTTLAVSAPLNITTTSLQSGTIGITYSQTLAATGGTSPYNWSINSGSLPAGLSLSSSGVISGTPTAAGSPTSVTFKVTDANSLTATQSLSITTAYAAWDVNEDGSVNVLDMTLISQDFGQTGTPGWIREDVNGDGVINIQDLIIIGQHLTG